MSQQAAAPAAPAPERGFSRDVIVSLVVVYVVWSSTYYALRVAVEELPALTMGGVRYLIAGSALFVFAKLRGARWPTAREWLAALPSGGLLFLVGNGFVALAEVKLSSAVAAVVVATMPMFAAAMAPLFGEKSRRGEWVGMGLGLIGVVVLSLNGELQAERTSALLLFVAPVGWAIGSMLSRKLPAAPGMLSPAAQMLCGGVLLVAAGFLRGETLPAHVTFRGVAAVVYLIVLGSLAGFTAYAHLLKTTRPALAMSYSYVNPPIAVIIGAALGKERIGPEMLIAVALIGAGTFTLIRNARK
ncbi:MAG: drug/metabolite exporter YedA [Myxococcaceae bacterium]|nr:drug/metabolite exporter YedA [Myxococcaceae bacterium]